MIQILSCYMKKNWIAFSIAGYFIFSCLLKLFSGIDICFPCLWTAIFGVHCPGCGLTTAFIALLHFDILGAYHANWFIFIVLPAGVYYIVNDFYKFYNKAIG